MGACRDFARAFGTDLIVHKARRGGCDYKRYMNTQATPADTLWWAASLDDADREIARLATLCNVRILDTRVIKRVLRDDVSVCGVRDPRAFAKLRNTLITHYHLRETTLEALDEAGTASVVETIVESLCRRIGERARTSPVA